MKVKIDFFCIQERKAYKAGDEYTGKRKDIAHLLEEDKQEPKTKGTIETKKKTRKSKK